MRKTPVPLAAVFDLDGVITDTASVHAAAWQTLFNDFLRSRGSSRRFDVGRDYPSYVDGRPRYEGVRNYLESVDITLPEGRDDEPPGDGSVCALGNRKNEMFREALERDGIALFPAAVRFVKTLRSQGTPCALATSSRSGDFILAKTGLQELFQYRLDGTAAARLGLRGKPSPDVFLVCLDALGCLPKDSVLFEDAIAGVAAGRTGEFGLVVGVDRANQADKLRQNGADVVISSFEGLTLETMYEWMRLAK